MPDFVFTYDPDAPLGERLAPRLREEIEFLAPSTLNDDAVTTPKIKDAAVTRAKLAEGAVASENIGAGEVKQANIGDEAVGTDQLADNAVTAAKAGTGIVTARDLGGSPISLSAQPIEPTDWGSIGTPDPATLYLVLED